MVIVPKIRECVGGIIMGIIGTLILIYNQMYFFSAWAFLLLFGLFFVKDKPLNGGIYGVIVVVAIMIMKKSLSSYPLLLIALIFIALSLFLRKRGSP